MRLETFGQTFQDFEPKLDKAAYLEFASTPAARPLLSSSCFPENPTQTWELESRAAAVHTTSLGSGSCFLPPKIASRRITGGERDRMQPSTNRYTEPPQPRQPRWSTGRPAGRCLAHPRLVMLIPSAASWDWDPRLRDTLTAYGSSFPGAGCGCKRFLTFWHRVLHKPWGIGGDSNSPSGRGWGVSSLSHRSQIVLIV